MLRVDTLFSGPLVRGGGINQIFFNNALAEAQEAADAVQAFWDAFQPIMSTGVSYEVSSTVTELDHVTGALEGAAAVTTAGVATGDDPGNPLPPSTQFLVRAFTPAVVNGRLLRGRIYVPGMMELQNGPDGKPTSGMISGALAAGQALIDDLFSFWVIWHRPAPGSGVGGQMSPVTSVGAWEEWAVLRSRRD